MVRIEEIRNDGIRERLARVEELLEQKEAKKVKGMQFKLPFDITMRAKMIARKNRALVFLLKTNRDIEIKVAPIINGMIIINERYYDARADCFFMYKGIPAILLPEWSLEPIGTQDYYKAIKDKELANAQQVIIRAIETKEMGMGKLKISPKLLIIGAIAAVVIFFVISELGAA